MCSSDLMSDRIVDPVLRRRSPPGAKARTQAAHRLMSRYIQEETNNGEELARWALDILRCRLQDRETLCERLGLESITDAMKLEMHAWLADRGFGKPLQALDITIDDDASVSDEQLIDQLLRSFGPEALRAAAERIEKAATVAPPPPTETIQ